MTDKPTVEEALAGVFGKPTPRLAFSGDIELDDADRLTGADVSIAWGSQKPEPPIQECAPE